MQDICILFEIIAANIWDLISRNSATGNSISENGISGIKIISPIQDYVLKTGSKRIFAQRSRSENQRGADIEIYIEYTEKKYVRYLFQAKALKKDGKYHDVNHRVNHTGSYQWDLLSDYSRIAGAIPHYLLYNGVAGFRCIGSDYYGDFDEKQYGCAVAEISPIREYCLDNDTGEYPFMINEDSLPIGVPWRYIPCCGINNEVEMLVQNGTLRLYSPEDIDMDKSFDKIFRGSRISGPAIEVNEKIETQNINEEILNRGWTPQARILISKHGIKHSGGLYLLS